MAADFRLRDLSGNNNPLEMVTGAFGDPLLLGFEGTQYMFSPGWDDMWAETPAPYDPPLDLDIRYDGDPTNRLSIAALPINWLIHQGSDGDEACFALLLETDSGDITLYWSEDGATWRAQPAGTIALGGRTQFAVTLLTDDDAGGHVVSLYTDPPDSDLDAPLDQWTLTEATVGTGTTELWPSTAPIRTSSAQEDELTFGGPANGLIGWGDYYRLVVRDAPDGNRIVDLDPDVVQLPLTWEAVVVDGNDAATGTFVGGAGETWSITDFATGSYSICIVDRPSIVFGNESHASAGPDDTVFDFDDSTSFTFLAAFRWRYVDGIGSALVASHALYSLAFTEAGWAVHDSDAVASGAIFGVAADGADTAVGPAADPPVPGTVSVVAVTVDRDTNEITGWLDGVAGTPATLAAVGSLSTAGVALLIAGQLDNLDVVRRHASMEFFASALIRDRVLIETEIALIATEWQAGGAAVAADDYTPHLAG